MYQDTLLLWSEFHKYFINIININQHFVYVVYVGTYYWTYFTLYYVDQNVYVLTNIYVLINKHSITVVHLYNMLINILSEIHLCWSELHKYWICVDQYFINIKNTLNNILSMLCSYSFLNMFYSLTRWSICMYVN